MCSISGVLSRHQISQKDLLLVDAMNQKMIHRGPDGSGEYTDDNIALRMRRLSIIDLSTGWQPLYNEDKSIVLIVNGEIYNYIELRSQLKDRGHHFRTGSDCETIVHLYEQFGLDFVKHLRGMFALALWDIAKQRLILARDRMGEKPLYIFRDDNRLYFASELKAILGAGVTPFKLDPVSVDRFFHYKYVPEPKTPIERVNKLDAGNMMIVDLARWEFTTKVYWRMDDAEPLNANPLETILEELETVSELVVRSDVPVGVALSGGLDSSAIAALAVRKFPGAICAFSVGYPGNLSVDERPLARKFAEYLGIELFDIELTTADMVESFPHTVYMSDDPIADISGHCYYSVMKLAREHGVPVILQGQGGDELFWGYEWVRQASISSKKKMNAVNSPFYGFFNYLSLKLPETLSREGFSTWVRSAAGLGSAISQFNYDRLQPKDQMVFYDMVSYFRRAITDVRNLYSTGFKTELADSNVADLFTFSQPWQGIDVLITRLICDTYLRENGMAQGDRLSMASSVELRLPLVDYRLVEKVIGLRKHQTDVGNQSKYWLKESLRQILPSWVIDRPKKGFTPPTGQWHRALFQQYASNLKDGYLHSCGILTTSAIESLTSEDTRYSHLFFDALVLETWCRQYHY